MDENSFLESFSQALALSHMYRPSARDTSVQQRANLELANLAIQNHFTSAPLRLPLGATTESQQVVASTANNEGLEEEEEREPSNRDVEQGVSADESSTDDSISATEPNNSSSNS